MDGINRFPGCGCIPMLYRSVSRAISDFRKGSLDRIAEGSAVRRPSEARFVFEIDSLLHVPASPATS